MPKRERARHVSLAVRVSIMSSFKTGNSKLSFVITPFINYGAIEAMNALHYGENLGLEERAIFLTEQLVALDQVKEWKNAVKKEFARSEYPADEMQSLQLSEKPPMIRLLEKMGLLELIKCAIINLHCEAVRSAAKSQTKDTTDDRRLLPESNGCTLDVVRAACDNWEKSTSGEMRRLAAELGQPLIAPKMRATTSDTLTIASSDDRHMGGLIGEDAKTNKTNRIPNARFLYDGTDLLRSLQAIKSPNRVHEQIESNDAWGSIQLQLYSPPFSEYRRLFYELAPERGQIGLDDLFPHQRNAFLTEKTRIGNIVLARQSAIMARQYSKTGCPVNLRPQIWRQVLSVIVTAQDRSYFEHLQMQVAQLNYFTDDVYLLDLQQTIDNSDYFVFQDHLQSVLMAFTRDVYVKHYALQVNGVVHYRVSKESPPSIAAFQSDEDSANDTNSRVPPNGVLPFSGLAMYMAPLAYLYADPVEIYFVFRELYARYWSKLNAIRTERGTILPLCKLFEDFVVRSSPAAVLHLINIGLQPLDIAFPWIQSAFSGVLDTTQVLLLWDRVIGYDSLEVVAIFAAALFHFRASELECVETREEADELFSELMDVPVITLMQSYLLDFS